MAQVSGLYDAIVNGNAKQAHSATEAALAAGAAPMDLIQQSMVPAMEEVGRLFEAEEYFVPELLLSGRAMKSAMELLKPLLSASGQQMAARVVIGTVKGDLHDIGKNLVASMLEGGGFEVIDLGA
ncbi:MAG: B12-binding domain-containing protein, partial [Acidobacteriaceae bacterium]|nr:B12-binding domain-containing protein [Acidobacteriaceae bacterium]